MINFVIFSICILTLSCGQILWKIGINKIGTFKIDIHDIIFTLKDVSCSPWMWIGAIFYILGTILWFKILSYHELNYALPILSLSYVITMFTSTLLLGEHLTIWKVSGTIVICLGVYLISKSWFVFNSCNKVWEEFLWN